MKRKYVVAVPLVLSCVVIVYMLINTGTTSCATMVDNARLEENERKRQLPSQLPCEQAVTVRSNHNLTKLNSIVPVLPEFPSESTISVVRNKFSIIIPTYKRMKLLLRVLNNYCALPSHVDMIIVVWNDLETEIPPLLSGFPCNATLHVKKEKINSLHNRFLPFSELRTEGKITDTNLSALVYHRVT